MYIRKNEIETDTRTCPWTNLYITFAVISGMADGIETTNEEKSDTLTYSLPLLCDSEAKK